MKYNPRLPDLDSLSEKYMPLPYIEPILKTIFPQGCINSVFKGDQSLKELLAPPLYPNKKVIRTNSITSCNKRDICKYYLICSNYFTCSVTSRRYYTSGVLHFNCINVIYLITCRNCLEQYFGSATNFQNRFRIHKGDIFQILSVQIIGQVYGNATDIEKILWHSEKYWKSQLLTTTHGMNSFTDLCCSKRKGYRK